MDAKLLAHELETLRNGFECLRLGYPSTEGTRQSTARALNNLARELEVGHRIACPKCGKLAIAADYEFYGYWFAVCETHGGFSEDDA